MPCQKGNEGSQSYYNEEWQAGNSGDLSILWHQNVPNWESITLIKTLGFNMGWIFLFLMTKEKERFAGDIKRISRYKTPLKKMGLSR